MMNKTLISIVGPTGIGKTSLSIKLANSFQTEIISADSRQFYREIPIGTAAPTLEEQKAVPHHFIHNKSITESYSVGDFERDAIKCIDSIQKPVVVMVGGSGLYVQAVVHGLDYFPDVNEEIRTQLNSDLKTEGLTALQDELKKHDPKAYEAMDIENPHRVIRALEICRGTGTPYSSFLGKEKNKRKFNTFQIGLTAERSIVYERINQRVDMMMEQGLLDEVKSVAEHRNLNALNTVGYKELFQYLDGNCTLEFAVEEIKKNTRRFAKRQLTWFKKQDHTKWFDFSTPTEEIQAYINSIL